MREAAADGGDGFRRGLGVLAARGMAAWLAVALAFAAPSAAGAPPAGLAVVAAGEVKQSQPGEDMEQKPVDESHGHEH